MPAILSHASTYPPDNWNLILKPLLISQDQLWHAMTKEYQLRMDVRHCRIWTTKKDSITKANLRMFSPEALKHLEEEASVPRRMSFHNEADISYVRLSMEQYREDRRHVFNNRMETISEDEEFQPVSHPLELSLEENDKLVANDH